MQTLPMVVGDDGVGPAQDARIQLRLPRGVGSDGHDVERFGNVFQVNHRFRRGGGGDENRARMADIADRIHRGGRQSSGLQLFREGGRLGGGTSPDGHRPKPQMGADHGGLYLRLGPGADHPESRVLRHRFQAGSQGPGSGGADVGEPALVVENGLRKAGVGGDQDDHAARAGQAARRIPVGPRCDLDRSVRTSAPDGGLDVTFAMLFLPVVAEHDLDGLGAVHLPPRMGDEPGLHGLDGVFRGDGRLNVGKRNDAHRVCPFRRGNAGCLR